MRRLLPVRRPVGTAVLTASRPGVAAVLTAALLIAASGACASRTPAVITGAYAALLASSTDLGPSRSADAQVTVTLGAPERPAALMGWADARDLWVRWRPGDGWAIVEGAAGDLARAFGIPVRDYRTPKGEEFYASPEQPAIPAALRDDVTAVGRVMSYTPYRMKRPDIVPLDVPKGGLTPDGLLSAYNATPLADAGFTGEGATIVIFAFDSVEQEDLDLFADTSGLPRFTPEIVGGKPSEVHGETAMDLQVAHAIAPDARLVVVNARPTVEGDGTYEKLGRLFEQVDRDYPGAVWSLSIGWGCEAFVTAADLAPVEAALMAAQRRGTTAFDASGDSAGLECKGGDRWSAPPGPDDIGVDAVASLPTMTSVGGTTLSTGTRGQWLAEHAWVDSPLSQGSSGGVAKLFARPAWQQKLDVERDTERRRLLPDVSAVADPFTGVRFIFGQREVVGGGTSQSAPIWAALTVLMNQYLLANGGRQVGNLNPVLYQVASGSRLPGFRDVTKGGNAVDLASPGYDLVTGLGSPNTENLARNILDLQKTSR
ncbi:peptidase S53 [Mycolicibacterium novocastrense]|uniref:Peptidase S8 and S53, subtilisin, kexin, sedolisin n=1 Tax=Mycolicibacterium novocastrense TaxID=59813 RepID=A0ABQ0KEC6_MYCNV|nr:S53 family peptidase [Mycolicibacterium novocastrense]KUH64340.1 peptidase S53 [Mycolicibacterium novocastrense]KUH65157.1 peptidase S53 [Mycolicibacterium novocastrense]KUH76197.1 peptidase S53 [Mycolicibacterium novocastrense]GAT07901.1 peptidase S8 and S53, subtilisin, kexin, sedolisin [Mycolicibacterium novocastrense]